MTDYDYAWVERQEATAHGVALTAANFFIRHRDDTWGWAREVNDTRFTIWITDAELSTGILKDGQQWAIRCHRGTYADDDLPNENTAKFDEMIVYAATVAEAIAVADEAHARLLASETERWRAKEEAHESWLAGHRKRIWDAHIRMQRIRSALGFVAFFLIGWFVMAALK